MKKTISELIDELSITNCKIALLLEKGSNATWDEFQKVQDLNRYRSQLKNAINKELGGRLESKTYE